MVEGNDEDDGENADEEDDGGGGMGRRVSVTAPEPTELCIHPDS